METASGGVPACGPSWLRAFSPSSLQRGSRLPGCDPLVRTFVWWWVSRHGHGTEIRTETISGCSGTPPFPARDAIAARRIYSTMVCDARLDDASRGRRMAGGAETLSGTLDKKMVGGQDKVRDSSLNSQGVQETEAARPFWKLAVRVGGVTASERSLHSRSGPRQTWILPLRSIIL
ncbi:hypothetical protein AcW1_002994 [Taiwanofungus camphoratus]|nr:hypothetical protein AcW1_002994 [Antrodia cinnamomea]